MPGRTSRASWRRNERSGISPFRGSSPEADDRGIRYRDRIRSRARIGRRGRVSGRGRVSPPGERPGATERSGVHFPVFGFGRMGSRRPEGVRDAEPPAAAPTPQAELLLLQGLWRHVEQADTAIERVVGAPVFAVVLAGVAVAAVVDVVLDRGASIGGVRFVAACDSARDGTDVVRSRGKTTSEILPPGAAIFKRSPRCQSPAIFRRALGMRSARSPAAPPASPRSSASSSPARPCRKAPRTAAS